MSIRINLLPHRELKRAQRRRDFYAMLALGAVLSFALIVVVTLYYQAGIVAQKQRNEFIKAENAKLDVQIKEVVNLKQEIEGLRARQSAVEDLQTERNLPVHLLDEMAAQVPEGVHLKTLKQVAKQVTLAGIAQSNERVSELLRNLGNQSIWLERPELIEIRSETPGAQTKSSRRPLLYEFSLNAMVKRAQENRTDITGKAAVIPTATQKPGQ